MLLKPVSNYKTNNFDISREFFYLSIRSTLTTYKYDEDIYIFILNILLILY